MTELMTRVTVQADAGTEFVITDGRRMKVYGAAGTRSFDLAPGIYKVRYQAGGRSEDQLFEVGEQAVNLNAPTLRFASPIPLPGTSSTHEYHEGPARNLSMLPPLILGSGGEIAFLIRDSSKQWGVGPPSEPWLELELQFLDGATAIVFANSGERNGDGGVISIRAMVAPGTYLLTRKSAISVQIPVHASAGWRTTVYMDCVDIDGSREPDLYGSSVVISSLAEPLELFDPLLKSAELAKQAIQKGRDSVDAATLSTMMSAKFQYPMLGIFAAHVLLMAEKPDLAVLKTVLVNLDGLIPRHPDVVALHCGLARHDPGHTFDDAPLPGPPMLRSSWEMLVEATSRYPALLPVESEWMKYTFALCGTRVWMAWQRPPKRELPLAAPSPVLGAGETILNTVRSWALSYLRNKEPEDVLADVLQHSKALLAKDTSQIDRKQIVALWSTFHEALRDPSIATNPLQSTLRRTLLSILDDQDTDETFTLDLEAIARDLRVPAGVLISAVNSLLMAARESMRRKPEPVAPQRQLPA